MRIALITTIWGRRTLTDIMLRHYKRIAIALAEGPEPLELMLIAAGSPDDPCGDPQTRVEKAGWVYVAAPNQPLGAKFNVASATAWAQPDVQGLVVVGSDDFLSLPTFEVYREAAERAQPLVGFRDIWFADTRTGESFWWAGYTKATTRLVGAGRWYGRAVLDAVKGRLWPHASSGLDTMAEVRIASLCPKLAQRDPWSPLKWDRRRVKDYGVMVDVKGGGGNMTSMAALRQVGRTTEADPVEVLRALGPETAIALAGLFRRPLELNPEEAQAALARQRAAPAPEPAAPAPYLGPVYCGAMSNLSFAETDGGVAVTYHPKRDPRFKVALMTTLWARRELSLACLGHHARLRRAFADQGLDLSLIAVGSPNDPTGNPRRAVEAAGWHYVEAPNAPLSAKHNAALEPVLAWGADALIVMGSDDLLPPQGVTDYAEALRDGIDLFGVCDIGFCDVATTECYYWPGYEGDRAGEALGAGRMYSRRILEALQWKLWPPKLDRRLDGGAMARIKALERLEPKVRYVSWGTAPMLGIKSTQNLWPLNMLKQSLTRLETRPFLSLAAGLDDPTTVADLQALTVAWNVDFQGTA